MINGDRCNDVGVVPAEANINVVSGYLSMGG